jgi:L-threonylcarbamoyladenylate synthase
VNTLVLPATDEESIARAVEFLRRGELVAFPTDTVYGLGALAFDSSAVQNIYLAKGRSEEKAIPVLLAAAEELPRVTASAGMQAMRLAGRFWPGPLTLVLPKAIAVPEAVAGATVGVRVPDHAVAHALLSAAGPLAVTSANLSGAPSPVTAAEVLEQLGGRIAMILDGGRTQGGIPSTVVDCTTEDLRIVREGPLTMDDLLQAL